MALLPILRYPDPRLHTVAKPVAEVNDRIRQLVDDMLATMYEAKGVGLAATQVDVHERVVVIDTSEERGDMVKVKAMVEKPAVDEAPSNLAVIGRYILSPNVLKNLNKLKSGSGGEIQLTDAIAQEIEQGRDVYGFRFRGQRFDCGSKAGFLQATVAFGLAREELRDDLSAYLQSISQIDRAAQ